MRSSLRGRVVPASIIQYTHLLIRRTSPEGDQRGPIKGDDAQTLGLLETDEGEEAADAGRSGHHQAEVKVERENQEISADRSWCSNV